MSNISYRAKSLEDVAQMFDRLAADAEKRSRSARLVRDCKSAEAEMRTWGAAAEIMRSTTLEG